jgi:hypothetical protein
VLIPTDADGFSVPEWAMIELQGEIVSQQGLAGQTLGDLTYVNASACFIDDQTRIQHCTLFLYD